MRISIPLILRHEWLKSLDSLEDDDDSDEADDHDFQVSLSFGRSECNFNPLYGAAGGIGDVSARSNLSLLQTEQSINPMNQGGNINELNL